MNDSIGNDTLILCFLIPVFWESCKSKRPEGGVLAPGCICTRYVFQNFKNMKILQKNLKKIGQKVLFPVEIFHECSLLAYVCVQFFSEFFEVFSYFLNFEKHTGCICTRVPKRLPQICDISFLIIFDIFCMPSLKQVERNYYKPFRSIQIYYVYYIYPWM